MSDNRERGTPCPSCMEKTNHELRGNRKGNRKSLVEQIVERVDHYLPARF